MSQVVCDISVSVDGYAAGPNSNRSQRARPPLVTQLVYRTG
jgi:hypothetical protein